MASYSLFSSASSNLPYWSPALGRNFEVSTSGLTIDWQLKSIVTSKLPLSNEA